MSLEQSFERIAVALETIAKAQSNPALTALTTPTGAPPATPLEPTRKRRTNAQIAADEAAEAAKLAAAGESESSGEADAAEVVTVATIKELIVAGIKAGSRPAVLKVITDAGAKDAASVKPADQQAVYDRLKAIVDAAADALAN